MRYPTDNDVRSFTNRTLQAIRSVPGVTQAGGTTIIPLSGSHSDSVVIAEGYQMKPGESLVSPMLMNVTPGYFEAMGTPLVRGRYFDDHDNETAPLAAIVDESLAQKFWPGIDPSASACTARRNPKDLLKVDANTRWADRGWRCADGSTRRSRNPKYGRRLLLSGGSSRASRNGHCHQNVRGSGRRPEIGSQRIEKGRSGNAGFKRSNDDGIYVAVADAATGRDAAGHGVRPISLFLSAVGIYGVLAYVVTQRTREIGIRIALGSTGRGIFRLVVREGLSLVTAGLVIGFAGALGLRRTLQGQIYGLGAGSCVIGIVMLTLGMIALAACALPARRATRVDPVAVLISSSRTAGCLPSKMAARFSSLSSRHLQSIQSLR